MLNLIKQRFGRLVVVSEANRDKWGRRWSCECDCGKCVTVSQSNLRNGSVNSCGCLQSETTRNRSTTHGKTKTKLFGVWSAMKNRCSNKRYPQFHLYGGRGIFVCKEWLEFQKFEEWAIMSGYSEGLTIDRINNNGNYSPENCRWADLITQGANKRNNRYLTYNGITKPIGAWAREFGMKNNVLFHRINAGWSTEDALLTKVHKNMTVTLNGKTMTISECASKYGVDSGTLRSRIRRGWPIELAIINGEV